MIGLIIIERRQIIGINQIIGAGGETGLIKLKGGRYADILSFMLQVISKRGQPRSKLEGGAVPSCFPPDKHQPETPMHASVAIVLYIKQESG